ncbi:hypothetical protein N7540_004820 [Penicillium herquei]|nr:hypothetical protein N7540_004820 [Penicillium herquei]
MPLIKNHYYATPLPFEVPSKSWNSSLPALNFPKFHRAVISSNRFPVRNLANDRSSVVPGVTAAPTTASSTGATTSATTTTTATGTGKETETETYA